MRSLTHLASNSGKVFANVPMLIAFVRWLACRIILKRSPIVTIDAIGNFGNFISFSEYWTQGKGPDESEMNLFRNAYEKISVREEPIAVDVGANLGVYSLSLAQVGFEKVYAFEPVRETYERLTSNLGINPSLSRRIVPVQAGLGSTTKKAKFAVNADSPSQSRMEVPDIKAPDVNTVECEVVTLMSFVRANGIQDVGLLKIDVEGFETEVLTGAWGLLESGKIGFVYSEIIPEALLETGSSAEGLVNMLESLGYRPVRTDTQGAGRFVKCTLEDALHAAGNTRNAMFAQRKLIESR